VCGTYVEKRNTGNVLDGTSYFAMLYYHAGSLNTSPVRAYAMLVIMERGSLEWHKACLRLAHMYHSCRNLKCGCTHKRAHAHTHTHKYAWILFKWRLRFPRWYSVGCVGGRAGLLRPFCVAGNLGNIWPACCSAQSNWAYVICLYITHNNIQGGARNVIPLIVHVTHFYYYKSIWHLDRINPHRLENCS